jgi:hypothetical protein
LLAIGTSPIEVRATTGCIYVYRPLKANYPCQDPNGCASGCSQGQYQYSYPYTQVDCEGDVPPNCAGDSDEWVAWHNSGRPTGSAACDNPWSAIYVDCHQKPEPTECRDPSRHKSTKIGDPVDVTTGALQQTTTDLDLGRGLALTRDFSSDRTQISAMGRAWRHSLDWQLHYRVLSASNPFQESVAVVRPRAASVAFQRLSATAAWASGVHGGGGLEGSEPEASRTRTTTARASRSSASRPTPSGWPRSASPASPRSR